MEAIGLSANTRYFLKDSVQNVTNGGQKLWSTVMNWTSCELGILVPLNIQ